MIEGDFDGGCIENGKSHFYNPCYIYTYRILNYCCIYQVFVHVGYYELQKPLCKQRDILPSHMLEQETRKYASIKYDKWAAIHSR